MNIYLLVFIYTLDSSKDKGNNYLRIGQDIRSTSSTNRTQTRECASLNWVSAFLSIWKGQQPISPEGNMINVWT